MNKEIWKKHNDFCYYEISNHGRIKYCERLINGRIRKEYIRQKKNKPNYGSVTLREGNKKIIISVHRLVYMLFKGDLYDGMTINHIDGDITNNHIDNLEQITQSENILKAHMNGHITYSKNKWSKLLKKYGNIHFISVYR